MMSDNFKNIKNVFVYNKIFKIVESEIAVREVKVIYEVMTK